MRLNPTLILLLCAAACVTPAEAPESAAPLLTVRRDGQTLAGNAPDLVVYGDGTVIYAERTDVTPRRYLTARLAAPELSDVRSLVGEAFGPVARREAFDLSDADDAPVVRLTTFDGAGCREILIRGALPAAGKPTPLPRSIAPLATRVGRLRHDRARRWLAPKLRVYLDRVEAADAPLTAAWPRGWPAPLAVLESPAPAPYVVPLDAAALGGAERMHQVAGRGAGGPLVHEGRRFRVAAVVPVFPGLLGCD